MSVSHVDVEKSLEKELAQICKVLLDGKGISTVVGSGYLVNLFRHAVAK